MDEHDLDPNPMRQFAVWYAEAQAAGLAQPDAAALATATGDGLPSVRMVLLKGYDDRGFVFYTNHASRKGNELVANPHAALVLYWQPLSRQVRIEGRSERIQDDESAAYFATRPRGSKIAAWASPQSSIVLSRADLDRLYEETDARFEDDDIPLPPFWGGYRIAPVAIEFWQGRENRFHDRILYRRSREGWTRERLAP
jgi:pyridoxamine 5'-phosphate oxidase